MPLNDMLLVSCILEYKCSYYFFYKINPLAPVVKSLENINLDKPGHLMSTLSPKKGLEFPTLLSGYIFRLLEKPFYSVFLVLSSNIYLVTRESFRKLGELSNTY